MNKPEGDVEHIETNEILSSRAQVVYAQLLAGQKPNMSDQVREALVSARLFA